MARRPAKLGYFRATFDLLGEEPYRSQLALDLIRGWEERHGHRMPAAVREWYSLEGSDGRFDAPEMECRQQWSVEALRDPKWEEENAAEWAESGWPQLAETLPILMLRGELLLYVPLCGDDEDPYVFDYSRPEIKRGRFTRCVHGTIQYILEHGKRGPGQ